MATSAGLGFDLEDVLQNAREADRVLGKMVDRSAELSNNMRKAFSVGGADGMMQYAHQLQEIQKLLGGISNKTLTVDVDTRRVDELTNALGNISQTVDALTQGRRGIELFDTQGVYATTKGIMEAEGALSKVEAKIARLRETYFKQTAKSAKATFAESIIPSMGESAPQQGTKEYKDAEKKYLAQTRAARRAKQQEVEDALKAEIEKRAIAQKELNYAKMTQDQKAAYVKQKMEEILRAEQSNINSIRSEYTKLLSQLASLDSQISRYEKVEQSGKSLGAGGEDALLELQVSREQVQTKLTQMYTEHQDVLADIAEKGALRRAEIISSIEGRAYTKTEALALANKATSSTGTGRDLQEALRALESAKMGDTMIGDAQSLKELNDAIIRVKGSLEKLQEVEHKENSIQPSLRNEYSRTIAEIEKLEGLKRDLLTAEGKEAALTGDTTLHIRENEAIIARLEELYEKRRTLEEQAHGLFVEQQRKHEIERTAVAIQEYQKRINKLEEYQKKYGTVTSAYANSIATGVQDAPNVRKAQLAIERLSEVRARLNKNDANYQQTLERLNSEIKRHEEYIQSVTNAEKHRANKQQKYNESYRGALNYSQQAKSLNDLKKAMEYLEKARAKEDVSTTRGKIRYDALTKELNRQKAAYDRLNGSIKNVTGGLLNIKQQFLRAGALMFSVSSIRNYVGQLMEVRGEFELQQRSLQAIIQNKDQADQVWNKTVHLAVQSPFRVKELVTYTKQLAAYRIETEKLYETNKMLADISSGLGVDMNRLILAYGQVKAANYLRGTELRQFSEAGVNILKELSDYFTDLEGQAVSVGEVFERVSKRMVSFADVEHVLKNLTAKGGPFYQMQEIQAETLRGQMMNLRDSIDLVMNDIGKSQDGFLKGGIAIARGIVENWEQVAAILASIGTTYALHKALIFGFGKGVNSLAASWRRVQAMVILATRGMRTFNLTTMKNPLIAAASLIIGALVGIVMYIKAASKEQEEQNRIIEEGQQSVRELSANFKKLANEALNAAEGSTEQEEALAELKRTYKDILPAQDLNIEKLRELKGNYDAVTNAIYDKINAQIKEKKAALIEENEGKELNERMTTLIERLEEMGVTASTSRKIVTEFVKKLTEGDQDNSAAQWANEIETLVRSYTDLDNVFFTARNGAAIQIDRQVKNLISAAQEYNNAKKELDDELTFIEGYDSKAGREVAADLKKIMDDTQKEWKEANKDKPEFKLGISLDEASKGAYRQELERFIKETEDEYKGTEDWFVISNVLTKARQELANLTDATTVEINKARLEASELNNIDLNKLPETIKKADETVKQYVERLVTYANSFNTTIKNIEAAGGAEFAATMGAISSDMKFGVGVDYEEYKAQAAAVNALVIALDPLFKMLNSDGTTNRKDAVLEQLKQRIRVIKDMVSRYKELVDSAYNAEEAQKIVANSFKNTFANAKLGDVFGDIFSMSFSDPEALFNTLLESYKGKGEKYTVKIDAEIDDVSVRSGIKSQLAAFEDYKKEAEELFDIFDLSKELKDLGLSEEVAKAFGFEFMDFDELRDKIAGMEDVFRTEFGDKGVEAWQELMDRTEDIEKKSMEERMKTYSKYLMTGMTEAVKIKLEEQRKLREIESLNTDLATKARMRQGVKDETTNLLQKQQWEDFKGSGMYSMMFEDLEKVGSRALDLLLDKIKELKGSMSGLDPTQMKEMTESMLKIERELAGRDPFKALRKSREELKDLKPYEEYEADFVKAEAQIAHYKGLIDAVNLATQQGSTYAVSLSDEDLQAYNEALWLAEEMGVAEDEIVAKLREQITVQQQISATSKDGMDEYRTHLQNIEKSKDKWQEIEAVVNQAFNSIGSLLEAIGVESDSVGGIVFDLAQQYAGLVLQAIQFNLQQQMMGVLLDMNTVKATTLQAAMGPIGWISLAISALATGLSAIFRAKDNRLQKQIDALQDKVENLQRAFEKLEEAMDNSFNMSQYEQDFDAAQANLQAQIKAREQMIAAEKAKKKTDHDQIKKWKEENEEDLEKMQELEEKRTEAFGGFGSDENYKSAAESFIDAWLEAYKETGDGLSGLQDQFNEFMEDTIKKQLLQRAADKYLDDFFQTFDQMFAKGSPGDGSVLESELDAVLAKWKEISPEFSKTMESLVEGMGVDMQQLQGSGSLSELAKGVTSISEQSAEVIAAYLSSMRLYIANNGEELKQQTKYLRQLWNFFDSIGYVSTSNGRGLRVYMV